MNAAERIRIEAGAMHLYQLGPRAIVELLLELAPADQVLDRLDDYRRVSPALLRAIGGDRNPRRLSALSDSRRRA